jgi:steroid delta-isomerase-like uncharacterized protein
MRHISFGIAVGLALVACGGEEVKPPVTPAPPVAATTPPPPATTEHPVEAPKPQPTLAELQRKTSEGIAAAINAHDAKKVAGFYTEGAVIKTPGVPDTTGREAIASDWQKRFDTIPNAKSMASRVFVKGDVVVVEWAWTGTHTTDLMGVKATEKPIGASGADVMWFAPDGLVKEQHTYVDMGTIMSQVGVSKQKGRPVPTLATVPQMVISTNSADETKNAEAAAKMFAAFEKKSEADFVAAAADDISWDDMTQPETTKGKEAAKKYFKAMTTAFPDVKTATTNAWGVGDFVIAEGNITGTHKAAFFGLQPTKKQINLHGLDVIQFKDGKVVKGTSYGNGIEMMSQLGLMPAAPAAAKPGAAPAKPAAVPAKPAAVPAKTDAKPAAPATPAKK